MPPAVFHSAGEVRAQLGLFKRSLIAEVVPLFQESNSALCGAGGSCLLQDYETPTGWDSAAGFVLGEASAEQRPGQLLGCSDG